MLRVLRSGMAAGVNAEAAAMHTASESAFVAILQSVLLKNYTDLKTSGSTAANLFREKNKNIWLGKEPSQEKANRSRKWRRTRRKRKNRAGARG